MSYFITRLNRKYALVELPEGEESRFVGDFRTLYEAEFEKRLLEVGEDSDSLRKRLDKRDRFVHVPRRNRFQRLLLSEVI